MDKPSPTSWLDIVLDFISKTDNYVTSGSFKQDYGLNVQETNEILFKLLEDGFIRQEEVGIPVHSFYAYTTTFDGRLFIENGGYAKRKEIDDLNFIQNVQAMDQIKSYQNRLLWGTWFAGIVAALLLLWQIFLYFYPVHTNYPYWFWEKVK